MIIFGAFLNGTERWNKGRIVWIARAGSGSNAKRVHPAWCGDAEQDYSVRRLYLFGGG